MVRTTNRLDEAIKQVEIVEEQIDSSAAIEELRKVKELIHEVKEIREFE